MKHIQICSLLLSFVTTFFMYDYQANEISILSYKKVGKEEVDKFNLSLNKEILYDGCYAFDIRNDSKDTVYIPVHDSLLIAFHTIEYFDTLSNSKISIPENFDIHYCKQINRGQTLTLYGGFLNYKSIDSIEFSVDYFFKKCFWRHNSKTLKFKFKYEQ